MLACFASPFSPMTRPTLKILKKISSYDHQISLFSLSPCHILCLPLTEKVISKTAIASTHFLRFSLHICIILMAIQNDGYNVLKIATTNDVHHHYYQSSTIIIPRKKSRGSYSTLLVTQWRTAKVTTTIASGTNVRIIVVFVARLYVPIPLFLCSHGCSS